MDAIKIYQFFVALTNSIFGAEGASSLDIPLIELPTLLEPQKSSLIKSQYEALARHAYYTHYVNFQKSLFDGEKVR